MSDNRPNKSPKAAKAEEREARLAEEMKANMRKRKGQKKARAAGAPAPEGGKEEGENEPG